MIEHEDQGGALSAEQAVTDDMSMHLGIGNGAWHKQHKSRHDILARQRGLPCCPLCTGSSAGRVTRHSPPASFGDESMSWYRSSMEKLSDELMKASSAYWGRYAKLLKVTVPKQRCLRALEPLTTRCAGER
jgi:hypothetical protein